MTQRIAVVGAGYAGAAAALELAARGLDVTVFEAGRVAGGRARTSRINGLEVDNGQHILAGAYTELLRLMALAGADAQAFLSRHPLTLETPGALRLRTPRLPAPLHLVWGLATAKGLDWADKLAAGRAMEAVKLRDVRPGETVADMLRRTRQTPRITRLLWEPLCLAALNTDAAIACARVFANVLNDTLAGSRAASDLLLPRVSLTELFPKPAIQRVEALGGRILTGARVKSIANAAQGWQLAVEGIDARFDQVILATAPHAAALLLGTIPALHFTASRLATMAHEPITTCYLQYAPTARLAFPMVGLGGQPGQWVFDRGQLGGPAGLWAVVISAGGPHEQMEGDHLGRAIHDQLLTHFPWLDAPSWTRIVRERRATFSCTPSRFCPETLIAPGLLLCGDYAQHTYPATLESAVRSGVTAATRAAIAAGQTTPG